MEEGEGAKIVWVGSTLGIEGVRTSKSILQLRWRVPGGRANQEHSLGKAGHCSRPYDCFRAWLAACPPIAFAYLAICTFGFTFLVKPPRLIFPFGPVRKYSLFTFYYFASLSTIFPIRCGCSGIVDLRCLCEILRLPPSIPSSRTEPQKPRPVGLVT